MFIICTLNHKSKRRKLWLLRYTSTATRGTICTSIDAAVEGRERPLGHFAILKLIQEHCDGDAGEIVLPDHVRNCTDDTLDRKFRREGQLHASNDR